ncbi:hypothetical protein [Streptomyces niveus]|uniref:hypothetical protein n=1 Tax=Streptomyces niveus TaxID=193462 RepID=UPI003659BCFA
MTLYLAEALGQLDPYVPYDAAVVRAPTDVDAVDFAAETLRAEPGNIRLTMLKHPGSSGVVVAGNVGEAAHANP